MPIVRFLWHTLLCVLLFCCLVIVIVGTLWVINLELIELFGMDFGEDTIKRIMKDKYVKKEKECRKIIR